ncbi:ferrous iron transport protein B [Candidatus Xianfuyuplasma coldseepsis]|uniref:Ferrous iron transport protein B n=1 Tax=Candidatus Xianfuyuplasma coldseepsis TaxID=2782163 RepID=A0A7L7KSD4_9MOLU|nr:ferrous iron transport protein B [Xianfuyuplasma coldseepsis]QMS85730.1 ferrous iron transport protein B [Xianfuyuplasma coldseepsis]
MIFLLAGNPNTGKSTFFNIMTQSHVHVGNYSGVTVEKRVHHIKHYEGANLVDLPGTYNVCPSGEDEGVVTYSLLHENYNGIINIIDSTHLKRNLHLTIQLLELGVPTLLVLNLKDALKNNGYVIDIDVLSNHLNTSAVSISARENNADEQLKVVDNLKTMRASKALELDYPQPIKWGIQRIHDLLRYDNLQVKKKWLALQILEGNEGIYQFLDLVKVDKIKTVVKEVEQRILDERIAMSLKGAIFNTRREFIQQVVQDSMIQVEHKEHSKYFNQKIDRILTHQGWGIPIFIGLMLLVYQISFGNVLGLGTLLSDWFSIVWDDYVLGYAADALNVIGITGFAQGLVVDGILAGIGGVLVFLPQIIVLFFLLAIMEGTGYMSRVAIVMDRFLSRFGFNGKSIVPIITGFGCTVPAIMATRTISDKKERILTILTIPFVSCSARLPIYLIFVNLFFSQYQALVMMAIYILGIVVMLVSAKLFSLSYFKGSGASFILEVPPYRVPQLRTITYQALEKAKRFVKKAGTFILVGSVVLWLLSNVGPSGIDIDPDQSFLAMVATIIAPIFTPLGFGSWQATSSLISGFLAKEIVVSSLLVLYGGSSGIAASFTTLAALSYVLFASLYIPCISTVATIRSETGSVKWTLFSVVYPFIVAYIVAGLIYGIGFIITSI